MQAETLTKSLPATTAAKFAPPAVELFVLHEAELLDQRRFREWMALFTDDGTYWVPAVQNQKSPFNQASLFYDDRDLMNTRVTRLEHPKIHVQTPPSRTVHQVGRVMTDGSANDNGDLVVSSTVLMVEYRADVQRVFAGRQTHRLREDGGSFRIVQKRVDLVNCDAAFEPMAVPI
jgi:3-phenylpropionate/cinnamic acid dioxygenase small subunit